MLWISPECVRKRSIECLRICSFLTPNKESKKEPEDFPGSTRKVERYSGPLF